MKNISEISQFSFEELVSDVNSVVEDLRWVHLELTLRNLFNEILFQNVDSIEKFVQRALTDVRTKLGLMELSIYTHERTTVKTIFRDFDDNAFWKDDYTPWSEEIQNIFRTKYRGADSHYAHLLHYTVDREPMTVMIMPVVLDEEAVIALLFVVRSNALIPRYRHFITNLSKPLSVSIDYILNVQKLRLRSRELETRFGERTAELEWTYNFLVKLVDSTSLLIMAIDQKGNAIIWNRATEELTGTTRNHIKTIDDVFHALGINEEQNQTLFYYLKKEFDQKRELPNFEICIHSAKGEQRNISWSTSSIFTDKGKVSIEYGLDITESNLLLQRITEYEKDIEKIIVDRLQKENEAQSLFANVVDKTGMLILRLDCEWKIQFINSKFEELTGWKFNDLSQKNFLDACIAHQDRENVEFHLNTIQKEPMRSPAQMSFHLQTQKGGQHLYHWFNTVFTHDGNQPKMIWSIGFPASQLEEDTSSIMQRQHITSATLDAKLSQRYRFMMKYVPFPLLHLDENNCIVNANPPFQEIIGMQVTYGAPISDFATLEVHRGYGDPAPCKLYILTKDGITITHRGIITTIRIYGKTIKEITLDI